MNTLEQSINDAQEQLLKRAETNPNPLMDFWTNLSPETKDTLKNSLIGGIIGGVGGAGAGAMSEDRSALGTGLMGALMGALAGGAGTLGYQFLSGKRKFPGETKRSPIGLDALVDKPVGLALDNPGLAAGTIMGGTYSVARRPQLNQVFDAARGMKKKQQFITEAMNAVMHNIDRANISDEAKVVYDIIEKKKPLKNFVNTLTQGSRTRKALEAVQKNVGIRRYAAEVGKFGPGYLSLLALPAAMGTGYLIDHYLRGDND